MYHEQSTVTTVQQLPTSYQNAVAEEDYCGTQVGYSEYNKLNLSILILLKTVSEALHSNNEQSSNLLQPLVTQLVALIKVKIHSCTFLVEDYGTVDVFFRLNAMSQGYNNYLDGPVDVSRWRYSTRSLSSMCGVARTHQVY